MDNPRNICGCPGLCCVQSQILKISLVETEVLAYILANFGHALMNSGLFTASLDINGLLLLSFAAFVSSSLSADESVRPDKDACCLRR